MIVGNIYRASDPPVSGERFEALHTVGNVVIERIVSSDAAESVEYRQEQHEWVLLLKGEATLDVAGTEVELRSGDYLFLEAGTPHTVLRTSSGAIWLGVHVRSPDSRAG